MTGLSWWVVAVDKSAADGEHQPRWEAPVLTICSRDFVGDLTGDPVLNVRRTLLGTAAAG